MMVVAYLHSGNEADSCTTSGSRLAAYGGGDLVEGDCKDGDARA
jgi:hypothetical protein